ncbi:uncharacterized protein LOC118420189 [Branchiostoma floridae]|uniref:Uncharacterized protein LOC118420189 n=1 Tax=Branchiostoma floridae TaxID=7739 RepID=A0A9J7LHX7_BRAFL|nr:uncharacterized protein LOC118420189 [Branchiostoma floridae]
MDSTRQDTTHLDTDTEDPAFETTNGDACISPYAVVPTKRGDDDENDDISNDEQNMSIEDELAIRSVQAEDFAHAKDTIQPNTGTYTAMKTPSEDTKAKAPFQNTNAGSNSTEDIPVDSAESDTSKNSAESPVLPRDGSTMRECPHPPGAIHTNEAYERMDNLKNFEYEHMYDMIPDAMSIQNASTLLYGRTMDQSTSSDQRPASMEPYAVRHQEEDNDDDNGMSQERGASAGNSAAKTNTSEEDIEPYAVRYQEKDEDDDNGMLKKRGFSAGNRNAKTITTEDNIEQYAVKHQEEDEEERGSAAGNNTIDTEGNIEAYAVAYMCENVMYSGQEQLQRNVSLKNSEDVKTTLNDAGTSKYGNDAARSRNDAGPSGSDAASSGNDADTSRNDAGSSRNDSGTCKKDTGSSENDADTSEYQKNDWNMRGTHEQRALRSEKLIPNPMYVPNGPRQAAGGTVSPHLTICGKGISEKITFGGPGREAGKFYYNHGVVVSANNEVFVVDRVNERVQVFSLNGTFIRLLSTVLPGGIITQPHDVTIDREGRLLVVVVTCQSVPRVLHVLRYTLEDQPLSNLNMSIGKNKMVSITIDPRNNNIIVVERRQVFIFHPNGTRCGRFVWPSSAPGSFQTHVAVDDKGNFYETSRSHGSVRVYNTSGRHYLYEFEVCRDKTVKLCKLRDILIDAMGRILVAQILSTSGQVDMFTRDGNFVRTIRLTTDITELYGLALAPGGQLVVAHDHYVSIFPCQMVYP